MLPFRLGFNAASASLEGHPRPHLFSGPDGIGAKVLDPQLSTPEPETLEAPSTSQPVCRFCELGPSLPPSVLKGEIQRRKTIFHYKGGQEWLLQSQGDFNNQTWKDLCLQFGILITDVPFQAIFPNKSHSQKQILKQRRH